MQEADEDGVQAERAATMKSWPTKKSGSVSIHAARAGGDDRTLASKAAAGEEKGIHEFGGLGMAQKRNGKSTRAWQMLHFLAVSKGTLSHPTAREVQWKTVEKRMQELRKWLRARFDISSDPLPYVKGSGYSAEFRINCAASYQK